MSDSSGGFTPPPPPPPSAGGGGPIPQRGVGEILSTAFEVYKANAAKLIAIVAIVVVPLALLDALFKDVAFGQKTETVHTIVGPRQVYVSRGFFVILAGTVIGAALAFVMSFLVQAAVSRAAAQTTVGDPVDTESSYRWAFAHLWSVLGIALLAGLVILGGLLLFVIPGLIFAVMLAVVIPVFVFEGARSTDALGRSWHLVKGHFWHVLGTILLAAIIAGFVTGILTAFAGHHWFLYWILSAIGRMITVPFTALVSVVLYLDLRARSESLTGETLRTELSTRG